MDDLKNIKKYYGEKMAHLCRDLFPTLLETPDLLYSVLSKKFNPSKLLYDDLMYDEYSLNVFKRVIANAMPKEEELKEEVPIKTPQELLDEAGYILYECHSEKDVQSFRHYYKRTDGKQLPEYQEGTVPEPWDGEELCTFSGHRLDRCHIFFAVKKNVDEIKREDFKKPERQDEYGTSVLSIQFARGSKNNLSIKNRYNHTVQNPDATFSNNLDNIIPGLTKAFEVTYGLNINNSSSHSYETDIPGYVLAEDGKYYKYNLEIDGIYYCPDNIIIDFGNVVKLDKSRYLLIDYFILDLKEKKILPYTYFVTGKEYDIYTDSFVKSASDIKSIRILNNEDSRDKTITINDDIVIVIDQTNQIKSYKNTHQTSIGNIFLTFSERIEEIDLPNVEKIGSSFLAHAKKLTKLNLPKCRSVGNKFLLQNEELKELVLPECIEIGATALLGNEKLDTLYLPKVRYIGDDFLFKNNAVETIDLPEVISINNNFLAENEVIAKVNMPNCITVGNYFLSNVRSIEEISFPKLKTVGDAFFLRDSEIKRVDLPSVETIGTCFLMNAVFLEELDMPKLTHAGPDFVSGNKRLKKINLPKLEIAGHNFLLKNTDLREVEFPSLYKIEDNFLLENTDLKSIKLPNCAVIEDNFLGTNTALKEIDLPEVETIGDYFLATNMQLSKINIPECRRIADNFLLNNRWLEKIEIPNVDYIGGIYIIGNGEDFNLAWVNFLPKNKRVKIVKNGGEFNNSTKK